MSWRHLRQSGSRLSHGGLLLHNLAATAADKAEHKEERDDPDSTSHVEVISHGPDSDTPGGSHRSHANSVVLGIKDGADGDEDAELEQADEPGEVDGANSESVSPGADEHEESVEADEAVDSAHESGNKGQLGSSGLAVNIAIVDHVDIVSQKIAIALRVEPSQVVGEGENLGGFLPSFHFGDSRGCFLPELRVDHTGCTRIMSSESALAIVYTTFAMLIGSLPITLETHPILPKAIGSWQLDVIITSIEVLTNVNAITT